MACSTKTLKISALVWDTIYAILGCAVIGTGIYILFKFDHFNTPAFAFVGLGLAALLAAVFGSLSTTRESSRLLKTFVVVLLILIVLQLLIVGIFWVFKTPLLVKVDETFDQLWFEQPVPIKPGSISQITSLERWLECCGNSGPSDYILPPNSCYTNNDKLNLEGCRVKFLSYIHDRWSAFNILVLVVIVVEIICAILAYVLANSILNRWRRSNYYPK